VVLLSLGLAVLTLVGLVLTWTACFPKRRGDTPYCAACGYNLTGTDLEIADARCPECGEELALATDVVRGERHRSPYRIALATCCLLLGLGPLIVVGIGTVRRVDWYEYKPTAWVAGDIGSDTAPIASKAIQELRHRWKAGGFTAGQLSKLAEACLAAQARLSSRQVIEPAASEEFLADLYANGCLSAEQVQRFFAQMVEVTPQVRPVVVRGQPLYVGALIRIHFPNTSYNVQPRIEARLDGASLEGPPGHFGPLGCFFGRSGATIGAGGALDVSPPIGRHRVEMDISVRFNDKMDWCTEGQGAPRDAGLYTERRMVTGDVEIIPEESGDPVKLTHSEELDAAVALAVGASEFLADPENEAGNGPSTNWVIRLSLHHPLPIGLAFRASAEFDGQQVIAPGAITQSPGGNASTSSSKIVVFAPTDAQPQSVTLILRSSKPAALRTPDLYEIWDGELRFENIPVVYRSGDNWRMRRFVGEVRRVEAPEQPDRAVEETP